MRKAILPFFNFFSILFATISATNILGSGFFLNWSPNWLAVLDGYEYARDRVLRPVSWVFEKIAILLESVLGFNISLNEYWKDLSVILSLYFGARAFSYVRAGLRQQARFRLGLGLLSALAFSFLAGLPNDATEIGNTLSALAVIFGFLAYDTLDALNSAMRHRKPGLSFLEDFIRYLKYTAPTTAFGLLLVLWLYLDYNFWEPKFVRFPTIALLCVYVCFLAGYWAFRGLQSSFDESKGGTGFDRFLKSSNTAISFFITATILGCSAALVTNSDFN